MEKPKVRFSHSPENALDNAISTKVNHVQQKGKVKVKSIVPINLPIKVLKNGKRLLLKDHENSNNAHLITEQTCSEKSNNWHASKTSDPSKSRTSVPSTCISRTATSCPEVDPKEHETSISETPANYLHDTRDKLDQDNGISEIQDCVKKLQRVNIAESNKDFFIASSLKKDQLLQETCHSNHNIPTGKRVEYLNCDSSDSDEEVKIVHVINRGKFHQESKNQVSAPELEDKENDKNHDLHKAVHKIKSTTNINILKDTTRLPFNKNVKSAKKPVKVKERVPVMPCARFKLISSVNKHADKQVKSHQITRSLYNLAGKANNVLVQPEISKVSHKKHLTCHLKDTCKNRDISSKNLLSQPEYNSMVCVMKKLKQIGEEKLIKDVESLPSTYKSLVNGKISAALDFAPYESVYKNLINLSVDDDELPARLTRTKDPEPRNRDITPSLDMFYSPKSTQEYFMSLDPQIFNPICVNTLSAFTMSNKIRAWRDSRDTC